MQGNCVKKRLQLQPDSKCTRYSKRGDVESAEAAIRSAQVAEKTLKILGRSYLAIDEWDIGSFEENKNLQITYKVFNRSNIPVQITDQLYKYYIGLNIPDVPNYEDAVHVSKSIVGPQLNINSIVIWEKPLTSEEITKIQERIWCPFVWGKIVFTDPIGETPITLYFGMKAVYQTDRSRAANKHIWVCEIIGPYSYWGD
jgi:hypothetical protein